jgi:tetratricopeptide (TPR) repeat protein
MLRSFILIVALAMPASASAAGVFLTILPTNSQPPEVVRLVEKSQAQMDLDFRADSIKTLEEAVALHRKLAGENSPDLIATLETLADAQGRSEQRQEAVKTCEEMVRLAAMHFPAGDYRTRTAEHILRMAKRVCELSAADYRDIVMARDSFAVVLTAKPAPDPADAIKVASGTFEVFRRTLGPACWECLMMRTYLRNQLGPEQSAELIDMTKSDAEAVRQEFGEDHPFYGVRLNILCCVYHLADRDDEAIECGLKASAIFNSNQLTKRVDSSLLHKSLVMSCLRRKRLDEAEVAATSYLRAVEQTCPPGSLEEADAIELLASVQVAQSNEQKAIPQMERILEIRRNHPDSKAQDLALAETSLAALYLRTSRFAEAEPLLVHALAVFKNAPRTKVSVNRRIDTARRLAEAYLGQSKLEEAVPHLQFVYRSCLNATGSSSSETQKSREHLVSALRILGRTADLEEVLSVPRPFIAN